MKKNLYSLFLALLALALPAQAETWTYDFESFSTDIDGQGPRKAIEANLNGLEWHMYGVRANADGDDIVVGTERMPMLRQQRPSAPGAHYLCLADFVRPLSSGIKDRVGAFAASIDESIEHDFQQDDFQRMLAQTLADRLAEATAEITHLQVRRTIWGYAPDENLDIPQLLREDFQGIRPALGYPSIPDTSLNFIIDRLIDMKRIGIRLTDSGAMKPHASVSGLMFAHPKAHYFDIGRIDDTQLRDYARRRHVPVELMRRFLASRLVD